VQEDLGIVVRADIVVVLLWAGAAKAITFSSFVRTIRGLRFGPSLSVISASVVVAAELVVGSLLLLGIAMPFPYLGALVLLIGFAVVGLWAKRRGLRVPCTCFGRRSEPLGQQTAFRALLFALLALVGLVLPTSSVSLTFADTVATLTLATGLLIYGAWLLEARTLFDLVRDRRHPRVESAA
jgi:hypothetical protein